METLADLCAATLRIDPALPAIEYAGRWHGWGEVQALARQVAELLRDAAPDAAVGFAPRNRPGALAALLGMLADRRSVRMLHAYQPPAALAASIGQADPAALVLLADDLTAPVAAVLAERGIAAVVLDGMAARAIPGRPRASAPSVAPSGTPPGAPRVEVLTSGTTGPPKPFALPHDVIAGFVRGQGMSLRADAADAPFLLCFPLGNVTGIYSVAASLLRGGRVVLLDRFTVEGWRDYVVRYRPSAGGAPPAAVAMILDADVPRADLASLTSFGTGSAPLDPQVQRRFEERYGIPVLLSYGATEFGGPVAAMTPALREAFGDAKSGSVGRAMPGAALRVRDPDTGALLGAGETGLVEVVSPRLGPDWIRTADMGMIDADGFLFLRGRADGAIQRGGFKLLPEMIEAVIAEGPGVAAVAVVGLADARLGEVPVAAIVPAPGAPAPGPAALEAHLRARLPATHVPARWAVVEALPRTASFKVDRAAVRALFA